MRIVLLLLLGFNSCTQKAKNEPAVFIANVKTIDSLTTVMDREMEITEFMAIPTTKWGEAVESYDSYTYYFNKNYPDFLKGSFHGRREHRTDSIFYYFRESLIKASVSQTTDEGVTLKSVVYYFDKDSLINYGGDTTGSTMIEKIAGIHLAKLREVPKNNR